MRHHSCLLEDYRLREEPTKQTILMNRGSVRMQVHSWCSPAFSRSPNPTGIFQSLSYRNALLILNLDTPFFLKVGDLHQFSSPSWILLRCLTLKPWWFQRFQPWSLFFSLNVVSLVSLICSLGFSYHNILWFLICISPCLTSLMSYRFPYLALCWALLDFLQVHFVPY